MKNTFKLLAIFMGSLTIIIVGALTGYFLISKNKTFYIYDVRFVEPVSSMEGFIYTEIPNSLLEDEEGEKMPVSTVGTTPLLSIDDKGYWIVSYDNGKTYSNVLNEDGNPVSALGPKGDKGDKGEDGIDGTNGSNGTSGDSFFKNVEQTADEVILTLANGTVISIPKVKEFAISISKTQNISLGSEGVTLTYTITGADDDTFVEAYGVGNVEAIVTATSLSAGEIRVTLVDGKELTASSKVFVMLCNKDKTITTVLTFTKSQSSSGSSAEGYDKKDGSWD